MPVNAEVYKEIRSELDAKHIILVAVSKTKPVEDILELYELGQRDFGENYAQELADKASRLPKDIRWHFIGHLQTNKVKLIAPFVQLIHGVDSLKLLKEIDKEAGKTGKSIDCLFQVHIAQEETKFGVDETEVNQILNTNSGELHELKNIRVTGLMGMASFTENVETIRKEFKNLKGIFDRLKTNDSRLTTLSMGMSADYKVAIEEGSTMVRIGSLLFGEREKK